MIHNILYCSLMDNQISSFPKCLLALTNLISLDFSGNKMTAIPDDMIKLIRLQYLRYERNPVTDKSEEVKRFAKKRRFL